MGQAAGGNGKGSQARPHALGGPVSVRSRLPYLLTMAAGLDFVMKCQGHSRSERFPKKKKRGKRHTLNS